MSAWTDFLEKVKAQNFGPDDSQVVSSLVHPARGFGKLAEFMQQQVSQAAGLPQNQPRISIISCSFSCRPLHWLTWCLPVAKGSI